MLIKCVPLGAGQDVGKSCVIVTVGGKNIMFDCGMHMGFQDERRYPDFSFISKTGNYTQAIDCVIVTHLRGGSNKVFPLSNGFCCFSISCFDKSVGQNGGDAVTWITLVLFHTSLKSVAMKVLST
jgi:hypothetical protein